MSLEDRIQESVEAALRDLRARIEQDVRAMVDGLVAAAAEEREQAIDGARQATREEAARDTEQQIADAEARMRATIDDTVEQARARDREIAAIEIRRLVEAEADQKLAAARVIAEQELSLALTNAENRASQAVKDSVTAARVGERELEMAAVSRLLESVRGLDGATSLSEVLDALALASGREAARAAVLVLRNDRLLGWKVSGFGARDAQPKGIDLTLTEAGVAGLAVGSARPVTTRDSQSAAEGPGFVHLPSDRMGLAVPVIVGGRVVAVVYADGVAAEGREHSVPSSWPEVIEILARHAARCLEALTAQKAAASTPTPRFWVPPAGKAGSAPVARAPGGPPTEASASNSGDAPRSEPTEETARKFARLLLSDIRLLHEPAVYEGRRMRNLLSRLGPEIDKARRLYDQRVPMSLRTRAELFHQELVATLAGGDPTLLGFQA